MKCFKEKKKSLLQQKLNKLHDDLNSGLIHIVEYNKQKEKVFDELIENEKSKLFDKAKTNLLAKIKKKK